MKKNLSRTIFVGMATFLLPTLLHAQDSLKISMIRFEYNPNGSMVRKVIATEESEPTEEKTSKRLMTKSNTKKGLTQNGHLLIEGGAKASSVKVIVYNYADYDERTFCVHSLSGIPMLSTTIDEAQTSFDLSTFPKGTYILTLTLDGEQESKKIIRE